MPQSSRLSALWDRRTLRPRDRALARASAPSWCRPPGAGSPWLRIRETVKRCRVHLATDLPIRKLCFEHALNAPWHASIRHPIQDQAFRLPHPLITCRDILSCMSALIEGVFHEDDESLYNRPGGDVLGSFPWRVRGSEGHDDGAGIRGGVAACG